MNGWAKCTHHPYVLIQCGALGDHEREAVLTYVRGQLPASRRRALRAVLAAHGTWVRPNQCAGLTAPKCVERAREVGERCRKRLRFHQEVVRHVVEVRARQLRIGPLRELRLPGHWHHP